VVREISLSLEILIFNSNCVIEVTENYIIGLSGIAPSRGKDLLALARDLHEGCENRGNKLHCAKPTSRVKGNSSRRGSLEEKPVTDK